MAANALTEKQEAFAVRVACEKLSRTDAYKLTYDCTAATQEQIHARASNLATSPKIAARIVELAAGAARLAQKKASYTLVEAMKDADDAIEFARQAGSAAALIAATAHKAKLMGLLVDKKEIKTGSLDESDVEELEAMREALRAKRAAEGGEVGTGPIDESNRPQARMH